MSPSATMPLTNVVEQQAQDLRFKSLSIGIVGAGIAGLGAAITLSQSGHSVELFERSRFANEVGAAIHVCPNAARVLEHWGFDFKRANALEVKQTRLFVGDTLEISSSPQYPNLAEKYGAPWYFLHRVDLHNELKRLAQQPKADCKGAKINLSSEVVDTDCENGLLTLANGVQHQKDLIIAADGIHSQFIRHVVGQETPASPTGMSAFRFLIPTEKLVQNPMTRELFNNVPIGMNIAIIPDRRLVWYPCRGGELQNFVGIHPDQLIKQSVEDWNVDASVEDLLATYTSFAPVLQEVCKNAEDLKLWKLLFRYPVSTWVKGRVVLIGDAAHPMLPHQGQAGGQAIEDGAALGVLFANIESVEDIPRRLAIFQDVRKGRASAMQLFSNAGQDEAEKIEAEAKQYVPGGRVPKTPAEFIEYNFSYDILKECARALATDKMVPEDM